MVGACYGNGWGVTKDETKAAEWYRKSAEQGNQHGQVRLGNCFRNGLGVAKDIDTAVLWYHRSADQGWWEAKHELKRLGKYQE
ncbi:Sel1 repeat family protein [Polychytrium aggregatum]|nr:Sel1 repeat family protein [Polychytrium aggregatum]KAI9207351.1 Sel1 repeat family protein [Polychytrium aggregatum]